MSEQQRATRPLPTNNATPEAVEIDDLAVGVLDDRPISIFEIAGSWRRRQVILLVDENGAMSIGELADSIAALEHGGVDEFGAKERKRVYVGLYQTHLEKLDATGVVSVSDGRGPVVSPTEKTGIAAEWIRSGEAVAAGVRGDTGVLDGLRRWLGGGV